VEFRKDISRMVRVPHSNLGPVDQPCQEHMHPHQDKRVELTPADRQPLPRSRRRRVAQRRARSSGRVRLDSAVNEYLSEVQARRSARSAERMRWLLSDFRQSCSKVYLQAITRRDLMAYMAELRKRGLADRTIFNRISALTTFLRASGFDGLLSRRDLPSYTEKFVDAYNEPEIAQLLQSANQRSRAIFGFFLGTGCREQEVAYMTWSDVDLEEKVARITAKPQWGWRPKDCEERCVPIPGWLVDALKHLQSNEGASSLIFPNQLDHPDGHFLGKLKALALRAGLNCGHCVNKRGRPCKDNPVCSRWSLHKFRRTFASWHHDSGIFARTLQAWLGHSNLETTLRYLRVADLRSKRIRAQVDKTFAIVVGGVEPA
jgi:integrase/recombinase XerD